MAYHSETALPRMALLKYSGPPSSNLSAGSSFPAADFTADEFILSGLLPSYNCGEPILADRSLRSPANQHDCSDAQQSLNLWLSTLEAEVQQPAMATLQGQASVHTDRTQARKSRESQKRYRERQKVQKDDLKTQLARTTEELKDLKVRQQELETKLSQAQWQNEAKADLQVDKAKKSWLDGELIEKPPLKVTLPGQECLLTAADMGSMTPLHFKSLWMGYMTELRSCLDAMQDHHDDIQQARLVQLVWDTMRLKCLHIFGAGPSLMPRPDILNHQADFLIGIFGLSNGQVQDLMFLRETYVLKECELKLQQAAWTNCVQDRSPDPLLEVTRVASVGTELRVNAAQCHQLVQRLCWAMYFGVMTMKQSAQLLMHSDPDLILAEVLLHHIAEQQGLPSKQEMLSAHKQLTTQNWTRFWQYTEAVNPYVSLRNEYIPIPVTASVARHVISQSQVQPVTSTIMLY